VSYSETLKRKKKGGKRKYKRGDLETLALYGRRGSESKILLGKKKGKEAWGWAFSKSGRKAKIRFFAEWKRRD